MADAWPPEQDYPGDQTQKKFWFTVQLVVEFEEKHLPVGQAERIKTDLFELLYHQVLDKARLHELPFGTRVVRATRSGVHPGAAPREEGA